jgi:hypothetical protein
MAHVWLIREHWKKPQFFKRLSKRHRQKSTLLRIPQIFMSLLSLDLGRPHLLLNDPWAKQFWCYSA